MKKLTLEQHEYVVLNAIIEDRLNSLKATIEKNKDVISDEEKDIRNYSTYDLFTKLQEVNQDHGC